MDDYAVKVTVRNGRILKRMKSVGIQTIGELAAAAGVSYGTAQLLVALKLTPLDADGEWKDSAFRIANALLTSPEDLWSEAQQSMKLTHNTQEVFMGEEQVQNLISGRDMHEVTAIKHDLLNAIETLTPREQYVLKQRHFEGRPCRDLADELGVGPSMISQIEYKAIRKLRHPARGLSQYSGAMS